MPLFAASPPRSNTAPIRCSGRRAPRKDGTYCRGILAGLPQLPPFQKLLVQFIRLTRRRTARPVLRRDKLPEIRLQISAIQIPVRRKPLFRRLEAFPVLQFDGKVDLTPFRVIWRLAEFLDLGKERLHELLTAPEAIGI